MEKPRPLREGDELEHEPGGGLYLLSDLRRGQYLLAPVTRMKTWSLGSFWAPVGSIVIQLQSRALDGIFD